ncbi:hypothetical protein C0Q70_13974 [Pomacea canaliculata]|uniref:Kelch domain-containing protein 3 n=1 Tax=Pomacea canaliculata TaxID=400727 RepID=A0A2T7NYU5_POMCA|nr:hypothetical protein C0Q70_13974 [Pomacea canaliculata]
MAMWTVHLEGGPRRVNHAAIAIGEKVFSFGGYCTGEDYETRRPMDVHVLHTETLRWRLLPTPSDRQDVQNTPYQRYGHTAVAYEDSSYIWGGRNDTDGACAVLFCFDTDSYTWHRPEVHGRPPGARDGHSACVVARKMYIFGGYEEEVDRFSNEIFSLDLVSLSWCAIHPMGGKPPTWRDFHTSSPIGDLIYIFGGRSDQGMEMFTNQEIYCNTMYTFNTNTWVWETVHVSEEEPTGRRSHSTFEYNGRLYVFGGYNGVVNRHFNDLHMFDPETKTWSLLKVRGEGPCPRRRQSCCLVGSKVFLFGGTSPSPNQDPDERAEHNLVDHSDLHILDMCESLAFSYNID